MTLLDDMYRDGTLISAKTFLDDLRKLNYSTSRVKDYFDALQSTRYHETFPVSGTYQKVFNLLKGTYNPGTSSVEVYVDGSRISNFEETSSNKITTADNVKAGSVVNIYYKNIPSYSPDEINQLMEDYSNFKEAASEFNSTLQSVKDTWLSDTSVMISTKIDDQLKSPLTELGNQIEAAKTESSQALSDLNSNIETMRSTYNSTNDDMTTKFNALKDTLSNLDTETTTIKSRIDEINKNLDKVDINMITSSILELESYQLLVPSDKDGDFTGKSDVTKFTILTTDKMTYTISAKVSGDDSSKSSVVLYDKSDSSKISQQGSVPNSDSISSLTFVGDGSTLTVGVHSSGSQVSFSEMTGTKTDTYVPYRVAITNSQYVPLINNGVLYYNLANGMSVSSDLKDVAHTHSDSLLPLSTPVSSTTTSGDYLITSAQLATISEVPSSECANPGILQVRTSGNYIYQTLITSINTRSRLSIDKSSSWSQWRTVADDSKVSTLQTQVDNSAVGTNLLINTSSSSTNGQTTMQGASAVIDGVYGRTDSYEQVTTPSYDIELYYRFEMHTNNLYGLTPGETYTLSGSGSHTAGELKFRAQYSTDGSSWSATGAEATDLGIPVSDGSIFTPFSHTFTIPAGVSGIFFSLQNYGYTAGSLFRFKYMKLEKGSVATDWCPNQEDKVNVADMRKPASDVAGIEEVNAKQDKIGYTPADDSKVLHSTVTQLNSTDMNTVFTAGFYQSINGTNGIPSGDNWTIYQVIPLNRQNGVQIAYETNKTILGRRSWNYTGGNLNFTSWVQFAEDSKVAHLSGANNFDTVPTVNNNPLLLASSLPSDLARTSQKANFTAGLQSGGVDVATAADLKSVEASAWRELDLSGTSGLYQGKMRIKVDDTSKTIYLDGAMYFPNGTTPSQGTALIDLSKVVNSITSAHGYLFFIHGNNEQAQEPMLNGSSTGPAASILGYTGAKITMNTSVVFYFENANYILPFPDVGKSNIYVTYDRLL